RRPRSPDRGRPASPRRTSRGRRATECGGRRAGAARALRWRQMTSDVDAPARISFDTSPDRYRHWSLRIDGRVATLAMDVDEDASDDYQLKLNSYDLAVDIELHDAVRRLRFEH